MIAKNDQMVRNVTKMW